MDWGFGIEVVMAATCAAAFLFSVANFRSLLAAKREREREREEDERQA